MAPQHTQRDAIAGARRARPVADDLTRTLRDDLLQDLLALGILTTTLRGRLEGVEGDATEVLPLIDELVTSIDRDVHAVRAAIARIEAAA